MGEDPERARGRIDDPGLRKKATAEMPWVRQLLADMSWGTPLHTPTCFCSYPGEASPNMLTLLTIPRPLDFFLLLDRVSDWFWAAWGCQVKVLVDLVPKNLFPEKRKSCRKCILYSSLFKAHIQIQREHQSGRSAGSKTISWGVGEPPFPAGCCHQ